MGTTIFIGNLPAESSEADVETLFAPFGEVRSVRFVIDHGSGNEQCYAFVDMQEEDAREATRTLNGTNHRGQSLVVNIDPDEKWRSKWECRREHEESESRRRRKPQRYGDSDADDEDEDKEKNDRDDDDWWRDEEDTSWYDHRGRRDEEDEDSS